VEGAGFVIEAGKSGGKMGGSGVEGNFGGGDAVKR
jgi:hypothetical protein